MLQYKRVMHRNVASLLAPSLPDTPMMHFAVKQGVFFFTRRELMYNICTFFFFFYCLDVIVVAGRHCGGSGGLSGYSVSVTSCRMLYLLRKLTDQYFLAVDKNKPQEAPARQRSTNITSQGTAASAQNQNQQQPSSDWVNHLLPLYLALSSVQKNY